MPGIINKCKELRIEEDDKPFIKTYSKGKIMIVYLAGPYSHEDHSVEEIRFIKLNRIAGKLMKRGYVVFSPISHSHPIAKYIDSNCNNHDFWLRQDMPFLKISDILYVCTIHGYKESKGIQREIDMAKELEIPIEYIDENLNVVT